MSKWKHGQITSPTGISATPYDSLWATIPHEFAGIVEGRYSKWILEHVSSDERYLQPKASLVDCRPGIVRQCHLELLYKQVRQIE